MPGVGRSFKADTKSKALGRVLKSANLGTQTRELLLVAVADAARGLAVADAPQQLPALLGLQPGRIRVALVDHWAAPLALLDALPHFSSTPQDFYPAEDSLCQDNCVTGDTQADPAGPIQLGKHPDLKL